MEPSRPDGDLLAIRGAIERTLRAHGDAVMRGDAPVAAAVFEDDVRWLLPDMPEVRGLAAARDLIAGMFAAGKPPQDVWHTTEELYAFGDVAVEIGSVRATVEQQPGQALVRTTQRYMLMWKRQSDGSWRIFRNMMNNGAPSGA